MQKRDSKICKILLTIILLCVQFTQLSAHTGLLAGEKKLRVAKTQWFDIIYPARCEQSAAILYEKADTVYEEVTAQYGLSPSFRMPVVITPAVQQFNAFWTSTPYNHIAIYDTGVSGESELAVFSETLLSTFRHELTHAVTYNMKNGFWRGVGKIFGDCVAPGMFSVTTGMAEGATVTSESAAGEGRLNDEYAKHYVKQAKIEDKFPSYHDVSGSADIQPGGAPYFFNGAFHQWLQDEYGMEPYAEFWYRVVNGKNLTISGAFKKSFGIKLKAAWKLFEASYEVPDVEPNPVKAGLVQDFFEPEEDDFSRLNDAGSLYTSLTAGGGRLVWLDQYGSRVFMADEEVSKDRFEDEETEFRQLFALRGIETVRISNDGRFVAASYITENALTPLARVKIYDIENKRFYSVKTTGLKDAVVFQNGNGWSLASQKYFNQHYYIDIYELEMNEDNSRITDTRLINEIEFEPEITPYAFTPLNDGRFAWLKKDRLSYSLCISAADGSILSEYAFPEGMAVRSLSYNEQEGEGVFLFSYAQKGTLPRLGAFDVGAGQLMLSDSDISGGVFEPVYWDEKIVYVGEFLRQNRLLCMEETDFSMQISMQTPEIVSDLPAQAVSAITIPSKAYNPVPYHLRGIFVPLSMYESDYFGCNEGFSSDYNKAYIGATYITSNPWTSGDADLIMLTGGWNTLANSFGTSLTINKGTGTSLLKSQTELKSEFDKKGWKQGGGKLTLSTAFRTGNISKLSVSNQASALFGKQDKRLIPTEDDKTFYSTVDFWEPSKIGITAPEKDTMYCGLSDIITATFSTIRRAGPGRFENKGVSLSLSYGMWYDAAISEPFEELVKTNSVAAAAGFRIPHILPFESKYGFTYNFPLSFTAKLLPSNSVYGYASLKYPSEGDAGASGSSSGSGSSSSGATRSITNIMGRPVFDAVIETTVFSMDIQKAIPGITALFLNDFYFACGYAATGTAGTASKGGFQTSKLPDYFCAVADGRGYFLDAVYFRAALEFTPNIGLLASSNYKMSINYLVSYTFNSTAKLKPNERLKATLGLDLNF